ncbi:MAG: GAF domain-containing protein [Alphaproteobacteria bacterium]|nr:GAF domain-containing protein [Alphaproteobacteria bacterium]MBL7100164.1 GAF domain-containing protein [Alphaproteobacteria bacterium]
MGKVTVADVVTTTSIEKISTIALGAIIGSTVALPSGEGMMLSGSLGIGALITSLTLGQFLKKDAASTAALRRVIAATGKTALKSGEYDDVVLRKTIRLLEQKVDVWQTDSLDWAVALFGEGQLVERLRDAIVERLGPPFSDEGAARDIAREVFGMAVPAALDACAELRGRLSWRADDKILEYQKRHAADLEELKGLVKQHFGAMPPIENLARETIAHATPATGSAADVTALEKGVERAVTAYRIATDSQMALQALMANPPSSVADGLQKLLRSVERSIAIALGFEKGEVWSIAFYAREGEIGSSDDRLHAIARSDGGDAGALPSWREGEGVVGASYRLKQDIIVPYLDLPLYENAIAGARKDPFWRELFAGQRQERPKWASVMAFPITVQDAVWGVLSVSSSTSHRFDLKEPLQIEPVRALATAAATTVALCKASAPNGLKA